MAALSDSCHHSHSTAVDFYGHVGVHDASDPEKKLKTDDAIVLLVSDRQKVL